MRAVVVYESLWGNTAEIARAVAEGLGSGTRCLSTLEATPEAIAGSDLIVAGSPVIAFRMPNRKTREGLRNESGGPQPADLSHPPMQEWLAALPVGNGCSAAFDTRVRGPFGSAAPAIALALQGCGYESLVKSRGFIVTGKNGPLREGEVEHAREWGKELAEAAGRA